jgi:hypothetical protein
LAGAGSSEEEAEVRKPVECLYVKEIALSLLRHRLDANGLARIPNDKTSLLPSPDVPFARRRRRLGNVAGGAAPLPAPLPAQLPAPLRLAETPPRKVITCYLDLKSPYAYLAIEPTAALEREFHVQIDWLPYTLDIPSYLGSARVGKRDNVPKAGSVKRSPAQW